MSTNFVFTATRKIYNMTYTCKLIKFMFLLILICSNLIPYLVSFWVPCQLQTSLINLEIKNITDFNYRFTQYSFNVNNIKRDIDDEDDELQYMWMQIEVGC